MSKIDETAQDLHFVGRAFGVEWARLPEFHDHANRLEACWNELGSSAEYNLFDPDTSAYSPAERVAFMALDGELDRIVARDFWDIACPNVKADALNDPDFLRGWIEGALS